MTMIKFPIWILLLTIMVSIQIAAATDTGGDNGINQTNASEPYYITIDPIGNHTIGDVFFINGTTNLPTTDNLIIMIGNRAYDPSGQSPYYGFVIRNIPILPFSQKSNGTNQWRVNVSDPVKENLVSGEYLAVAHWMQNDSLSDASYFSLLPARNSTPALIQTTIPISTTPFQTGQTTPSSPFTPALPIAVVAAMVIMGSRYKKK